MAGVILDWHAVAIAVELSMFLTGGILTVMDERQRNGCPWLIGFIIGGLIFAMWPIVLLVAAIEDLTHGGRRTL